MTKAFNNFASRLVDLMYIVTCNFMLLLKHMNTISGINASNQIQAVLQVSHTSAILVPLVIIITRRKLYRYIIIMCPGVNDLLNFYLHLC